ADYTALDALAEEAEDLNGDLYSNFDEIYWGYIFDYVTNYIPDNHDYVITRQDEVDAMVNTLQGYIDMLELKGADYTAVNTAKTDADAEANKGIYTDESVAAYNAALADIKWDYTILDQATVDGYVAKIAAAKELLVEKDADYTELDALVGFVNGLYENFGVAEDGTEYTNFDDIYWTYMFDFIMNVDAEYGKKISEQAEVDALTAELQRYVDMLETAGGEPTVESFKFVDTADYKEVDGVKYAYGFKTLMTKSQFANYVECEGTYYELESSNSRYVGTGSVIRVYSEATDELLDEYVIVIYGDVDGNARVDFDDASLLDLALSGEADALDGAAKLAANVFGSRATINAQDADYLREAATGFAVIDQVTGKVAE
ncbi:MAG: hypothetical protein MJ168_12460, partial [Clostridia bacterium]|nr:hypothetical protein [Clostridia bacterium]